MDVEDACPEDTSNNRLTVATIVLGALCVDPDRIRIVHVSVKGGAQFSRTSIEKAFTSHVQLLFLILMQCVLSDCLESLLDIDGLLCGRLKVGDIPFGLAPSHRAFLGYLPLVLFHIDLVAQHDEREVLRVPRASLNEELISPTVQGLERLGAVDVINEDAAVRTAVERDTEGLESLLTSSVPQLLITGNILLLYIWWRFTQSMRTRSVPA